MFALGNSARLQTEHLFRQHPLFAGLGLRQRLLELPHQLFPFAHLVNSLIEAKRRRAPGPGSRLHAHLGAGFRLSLHSETPLFLGMKSSWRNRSARVHSCPLATRSTCSRIWSPACSM